MTNAPTPQRPALTAQHTPGPWETTYAPGAVSPWGVCLPNGGDVLADGIASEADATLMAAAPDLLAVLELWVDATCHADEDEAEHLAYAVVAKARGRSA